MHDIELSPLGLEKESERERSEKIDQIDQSRCLSYVD